MRELWNVRKAQAAQMRIQQQQHTVLAWATEAFARTKTLPPLTRLLRPEPRRQTSDEQVGVLHQLSDLYGIPLVITAAADRAGAQERQTPC